MELYDYMPVFGCLVYVRPSYFCSLFKPRHVHGCNNHGILFLQFSFLCSGDVHPNSEWTEEEERLAREFDKIFQEYFLLRRNKQVTLFQTFKHLKIRDKIKLHLYPDNWPLDIETKSISGQFLGTDIGVGRLSGLLTACWLSKPAFSGFDNRQPVIGV